MLDFAALIQPLAPADFVTTYWDRRVYLQQQGDPHRYDPLLTRCQVEEIVAFSRPQTGDRHLEDGETQVPDPTDAGRQLAGTFGAYHDGVTINLNAVHRRWPPLARFCAALQDFFTHPVSANLYLTPPASRGLGPHFDGHNVFVLQIAGSKHWRVYRGGADRPLLNHNGRGGQAGEVECEMVLRRGDLLYIPRGRVHHAWTVDDDSLHLTVGVKAFTRADLLAAAVQAASHRVAGLRDLLPVGFVRDPSLLEMPSLTDLDAAEASCTLAADWLTRELPRVGHRFDAIDRLDALTPDTRLERTGLCVLREESGRPVLHFAGNHVGGPARLRDALVWVVAHPQLCARDLPLEEDEAMTLVRRLVREGLLQALDPA